MMAEHQEGPNHGSYSEKDKQSENIDFESLIKGMEDIQNHALNQHEQHLDDRVYLRSLEEKIENICNDVKQIKNKNEESEGVLYSLQCQNSELKQFIARENALVLAAEEQRETVQRKIDSEKADYVKILQEHEVLMAKFSAKFRDAPKVYSKEKMQEETLKEAQELEALKTKEAALLLELEQFRKELAVLSENKDLDNFRMLVEETEAKLLKGRKVQKKEKKKLVKKQEDMKKLQEEIEQLTLKNV